jgi:hypothetical protein
MEPLITIELYDDEGEIHAQCEELNLYATGASGSIAVLNLLDQFKQTLKELNEPEPMTDLWKKRKVVLERICNKRIPPIPFTSAGPAPINEYGDEELTEFEQRLIDEDGWDMEMLESFRHGMNKDD